jgi:preprotein translocase subunit SecG
MEEERNVSTNLAGGSESDTVISKKPLIRISFILGVLLFISVLGLLYFYSQAQSYKQQLLRITEMPTPTPRYIYVDKPTPIVLKENRIIKARQTVQLLIPKFLDSPQDKETYIISFEKISSDSTYTITNDMFPKLMISDETYELSIQIPKEGFNQPFDTVPQTTSINTDQFNKVTRITNKELVDSYSYTTDYSTNCTQHQPLPKACSSKQVYFYPKSYPNQQVGAFITCVSSKNIEACDKLVETVSIDIK